MAKTWNRVFSGCGIGTYHLFVDLNKLDGGNSGAVVVSRSKRHRAGGGVNMHMLMKKEHAASLKGG
jgi:hypothetical protein